MASRKTSTAAAWVLASLFVSATGLADPTSADRETARALMQQGRDLRDKGDLKEALKRFKGANDLMHVPTTGLELARTQVALGLLVEARDTVASIRQTPARPNEPAPFKDARDKAEDLDAGLNGRVPSLVLTAKGAPEGERASYTIDGNPVPDAVSELPRAVDPGHHVITARTAHSEGKAEADVKEGEQKPVEVPMTAAAAPPVAEQPPPATGPEAPPPPTRSHKPTWLTWTGIGLAGAGVIAGAITGYLAISRKSTLSGECANSVCGPSAYSDLDQANMMATISDVAFAAAGVGAVVTAVTLLVGHQVPGDSGPQEAPPPTASIHPWFGPGSAGLGGTF